MRALPSSFRTNTGHRVGAGNPWHSKTQQPTPRWGGFRRLVRSLSLRPFWLLASKVGRSGSRPPLSRLLPGFQPSGSPLSAAGYNYGATLGFAPAGPSPASSTASLAAPLPTPSCCASQAAATSLSRCSSTAPTPRRPRSPRRSAPLSAAPASRSPGPSCANACASTTLVSVSPSKLSNSAASPSAAPTAGTCPHDPHRPLPSCSHPATVPLFHRSAPGTHSERNDHRHTPRHLSCIQPRPGARNATPEPDWRREIAGTYASPQRRTRQANQRENRRRS